MFYVVAFDPIMFYTCQGYQNESLNLSFVQDINVVGKKMTRNSRKMAKLIACAFRFETEFIMQNVCQLKQIHMYYVYVSTQ